MAVGGIGPNRKTWSANLMPGTDHLPATLNIAEAAVLEGPAAWGAHLADELERIIALHDASNVAAVIVEPLAGSAGVLVPPVGYLEKLREITSKHGILLIFDEVITAFGRLGAATAAERFNVTPDLITMAKAINNAAVPMGAVAGAATGARHRDQRRRAGMASNCCTAIPIRAIRWRARRPSPRWTCTSATTCSAVPPNWRRSSSRPCMACAAAPHVKGHPQPGAGGPAWSWSRAPASRARAPTRPS